MISDIIKENKESFKKLPKWEQDYIISQIKH